MSRDEEGQESCGEIVTVREYKVSFGSDENIPNL